MNEFIVVDVMNEAMIELLQEKNENCEKNLLIREYLKDKAIFFKLDRQKVFKILQTVGVKDDQLNKTYLKLTSKQMFDSLLNNNLIKTDDKNLVINYTNQTNNTVF